MRNEPLLLEIETAAHLLPAQAPREHPARWLPAKTTPVFDLYWYFAAERQSIFFRRMLGVQALPTKDPILAEYKFTNAYRASDRVSQYLIKKVIYKGEPSVEETFFRILIFKTFNKIATWELLTSKLGPITYSDFTFRRYDAVLSAAMRDGRSIYSAAYIMPSGNSAFGKSRKHQNHLELIKRMMDDSAPARIAEASSMRKVFEILLSYPMIGEFLAYQYTIDINYSKITNFSENDFVVPGPGALDGISKCFSDMGGLNEVDIIKLMTERQADEFKRLDLKFPSLWGRPLQLIDCQNLFCEVGKYARVSNPEIRGLSGRVRIKQRYTPSVGAIDYWYPPKWGLNRLIEEFRAKASSGNKKASAVKGQRKQARRK